MRGGGASDLMPLDQTLSRSARRRSPAARHAPPWAMRIVVLALFLAIWQGSSVLGLISDFLLPSPLEIARSLQGLFRDNDVIGAFMSTFIETLGAFAAATAAGVAAGFGLHRSRLAGRAYTDWLGAIAAAPLVLLYPVFLVVIGRNVWTIIVMGAIVAAPPIALKSKEGLDGVRPVLIAVGRSLGLDPWRMFRAIQLPAALPTIFTGLRLGLIFALINTVGVEFLLAFGGLGSLISNLGDHFDLPAMYAAILFVVLVSVIFLYLTERAESWLLSSR